MVESNVWFAQLEHFSNLLNVILLLVLAYTLYPLLPSFRFAELAPAGQEKSVPVTPDTPIAYNWKPRKFPETRVWRTYTPQELREFDGRDGKAILFAVNRLVYDVSAGRNFYGPDGPYGNFAGRDASRGLAKQSFDEDMLAPIEGRIDTLDDLTAEDRDNLKEWEGLFKSKYLICGELIENIDRAAKAL